MRVLIITGGFFPGKKYGGPPVSINNFCSLMKNMFECFIVTLNHDLFEKERYDDIHDGWNDRGNCKVLYLSESLYNKSNFERIINEIKPDILYLQGLFQSCILPCLQIVKKNGIKTLLAPRGELCDGALLINRKKYKKLLYIYALRTMGLLNRVHFQSTSEEETESIKRWLGVEAERIHFLDNIPSIPIKRYPGKEKITGEGHFVFISRINPKKNLLGAISFFRNIRGKAVFDIYGPIEDRAYWEKCKKEVTKLPDNVKVEYKGLVEHEKVHEIFGQYDAFLFPTLSENFGHVIAESLMARTPVIISDQTPWSDVSVNGVGWAIGLNDVPQFAQAIQTVIDLDSNKSLLLKQRIQVYVEKRFNLNELMYLYQTAFYTING